MYELNIIGKNTENFSRILQEISYYNTCLVHGAYIVYLACECKVPEEVLASTHYTRMNRLEDEESN